MSDFNLLNEISVDIEKALIRLELYEQLIKDAEPLFNLEGQKLEFLCRSQPAWLAFHIQKEQELRSIEEILKLKKEEIEGKLWKRYVEGYSRQLSSSDIKQYIAAEPNIVGINQIIAEVSLVKNKMSAIVEGFRQMGWGLKNITALRVNQLHQEIL